MQLEHLLLPSGQFGRAHVLRESLPTHHIQYHIIVIPGNPGIASFYLPFAEELHAKLNGTVSVRCVNLAGFTKEEHETVITHQQGECNTPTAPAAGSSSSTTSPSASTAPHSHAHSHSHTHVHSHPVAYTLTEQCAFLHSYLTTLHLQLHCADAIARGEKPSVREDKRVNDIDLSQIISKAIRPAAANLPRRQHRFVLVCHSIGCYMGLEVMKRARAQQTSSAAQSSASFNDPFSTSFRPLDLLLPYLTSSPASVASTLPPLHITHTYLLFPFIRIDLPNTYLLTLRFLLLFRKLVRLLTYGLKFIPYGVWSFILRHFMHITSTHAIRAVYDTYTNINLVDAAILLAKTEFDEVLPAVSREYEKNPTAAQRKGRFDERILNELSDRLTLFYAGKEYDCWGPLTQMTDFSRILPHLDMRIEHSATHAWCAYLDQSRTMAEKVAVDVERVRLKEMMKETVNDSSTTIITKQTTAPVALSNSQILPSRL